MKAITKELKIFTVECIPRDSFLKKINSKKKKKKEKKLLKTYLSITSDSFLATNVLNSGLALIPKSSTG